jgi:hypothetical protein
MLIRHIIANAVSTSSLIALVIATALVGFPVPSCATDIGWHAKAGPATWRNANYERRGDVDFKTGEQGSFLTYGTNHPVDNGLTPWVSQTVFRFDDLSSISVRMSGNYDPASQITKGSGEIMSGTGRFEGITGKVTLVGSFSGGTMEADWVGSYSLPAVSRGLEQ